MIDKKNIQLITETAEDFFSKMTFRVLNMEINFVDENSDKESINLDIKLEEPQILIGEKGQTLFEIQKLLRMILNKKLESIFYLNLDINDYKKKKNDYLKKLAKEIAEEVSFSKKEKALLPMSSYERRIVHAELSGVNGIKTESRGDGQDRYIVVMPN